MQGEQDDSGRAEELAVEIGPSGRLRAALRILAVATGILVASIVLVLLFGGDRQAISTFGFLPIQAAIGMAPYVVVSWRVTVQIDSQGVRILGGPQAVRGDWAWDDLLEVCLTRQGVAWTLAVRPRGSTWDEPGPTAPAIVQPPMKDRATVEWAQRALRSWCADRGVVFTETTVGLGSAGPGSPLRPNETRGKG